MLYMLNLIGRSMHIHLQKWPSLYKRHITSIPNQYRNLTRAVHLSGLVHGFLFPLFSISFITIYLYYSFPLFVVQLHPGVSKNQ